ncbi:MAG TPA: helix-turn-helix domain-containing protein [Cryptosporangiaceae bacterium]|nr:helix-turn-helix domain-containing protein [Cryptosporangiaceae bacterium]
MSSIGERLANLRTAQRLTQRELAERAEVSVDLVCKLEQGRKHTARLSSLTKLARALDADLAALVSDPVALQTPNEDAGILAIRRVLTPATTAEPTGGDQAQLLADAWAAYWRGDYDTLGVMLPTLIAHASVPAQRAEALNIATSLLVHSGKQDLAYLAVRQAIQAAENAPDPLLRVAMVTTMAWAFLVAGRPEDGYKVAEAVADEAEPASLSRADPVRLAVWGNVVVKMATSAARAHQPGRARDALRLAGAAAAALDTDAMHFHSPFGPSLVTMQAVDVELQDDNYGAALQAAGKMPPDARLPLAARARHLTDVAFAQTRLGRDADAEKTLLGVERMAPEWITHQSWPRTIVAELVERERRVRTPHLRGLAQRLGVPA